MGDSFKNARTVIAVHPEKSTSGQKQPIFVPPGMAGPYAPNHDERTMAMLIHLLAILTGIIGTLILWLVKKDTSHFIDHHGKEAVNFQITLFIVSMVAGLVGVVLTLATAGIGLILLFPLMATIYIGALVFEILSCIKQSKDLQRFFFSCHLDAAYLHDVDFRYDFP